ncbi:MAG: energy-coupling factor ABC transporter ATP-binding protein [Thermoproteota archaeon]
MVEIIVENLFFRYPESQNYVLKNINLRIGSGESIAILGENGAGKTTLAKNLNGLIKPTEGSVKIDGVDTRDLSVAKIAKKIGFVNHNPDHQFFAETVEEEVAFALRNFGFTKEEIEKMVLETLKLFGLEEYRFRNPFQLSGGEKKRLAIASIMAWHPDILIIDEPTIGMDYAQKINIRRIINSLLSEKRSIIVITHDIDFAANICERAVILSKGEIIGDGRLKEVFSRQDIIEKAFLKKPFILELEEELNMPNLKEDFEEISNILVRLSEKCHS